MTTYLESQDLKEGQKQHSDETQLLFKIKPAKGLTKTQTIHCMKYAVLCIENNWDLDEGAQRIGITRGECLDILECKKPFTDEHQHTLYKTTGIKISTIRLDKNVRDLYNARVVKFKEIQEKYSYAIKPIRRIKTLLDATGMDTIAFSLGTIDIENGGLAFKGWRAAEHHSQYSVADNIAIRYGINLKGKRLTFCTRSRWSLFEISNHLYVDCNRAFYKTFGITVEQATAPFREYFRLCGIEEKQQFERDIRELRYLERLLVD